ncbi:autotransporter-associated beta strand protein, partial [Ancylobacter vacuolatus]
SGTGALTKSGAGTLILSGSNTYQGGTTISAGTLQVGDGGTTGAVAGNITNNGTLAFNRSNSLTYAGVISGSGSLTKSGAGTLTLSGSNSFTGATTVAAGTLALSGGSSLADAARLTIEAGATVSLDANETVGSLAGAGSLALGSRTLTTGGDNTSSTFSGVLDGTGSLTKSGTGTLTLSGSNTATGTLSVAGGTVDLTGSVAGAADVASGATLQGSGSVAGSVSVHNGGTLAGVQGSGLTLGGLDLAATSNVNVTLGATTDGGVFTVTGDVTLDGTLNVTQATGFGAGVYTFISYTGDLTDNGMNVAALTGGLTGGVQTSVTGKVNLVVEGAGATIQFWNGSTTTPTQKVEGGDGSWTAGVAANWTNASGTIPQAWNGGFAVFQGTAGTVTVDNGAGAVGATGLQFVTTGYTVTGGTLALTGTGPATIRVGDGTEAGKDTVATIASVLTGTAGLEKTDYGTLILSGSNTYEGGTTVSAG